MDVKAVFKTIGAEELARVLRGLGDRMRPMLRKSLRAGGDVVHKAAYDATPVLAAPVYRKGVMIRQPGTIRAALSVRSSRDATRAGNVGVFVNVRPAKGAARGKYSPTDPFYWRFVNFGTKKMAKRDFLSAGAKTLTGGALDAIEATLAPEIQKLNGPGAGT